MENPQRYFLHLGYNGTNYSGWQRQKNAISIQQTLEEALEKKFARPINCWGCGRTDAGVHASQFFAHVNLETALEEQTIFHLNQILPHDIALFDIIQVPDRANAQLHATSRTYNYYLHTQKHPLLNNLSTFYKGDKLNLNTIAKAVNLLTKHHDFLSFCKTPRVYKHTLCEVSEAQLFLEEKTGRLRLQLTANRFVRGMIRLLVARLLELGRGEISYKEFESYLVEQQPTKHKNPANPDGLYLSKITYPFLDIPPTNDLNLLGGTWLMVK